MASGSQNMTTFQAKHLIGDSTNVGWAGALLHSGTDGKDNTMDTWIFADDYGTAAAPWGIKHDQTNNRIVFVGADTEGVWITLDTGDTYILGKVGIGYDPSTSGNTYKLYVNGISYFANSIGIAKAPSSEFMLDANGPIRCYGEGSTNRIPMTSGLTGVASYGTANNYGTIIYANGISMRDPYNNTTNNDCAFIRHIETTANSGYLEIGVGDDGDEPIYIRQYNTSSAVVRTLTALDASGYTSIPVQVTIGTRVTSTAPGASLAYVDRIIITPYYHTGGPWYIRSGDSSDNAFLEVKYGTKILNRLKHTGDLTSYGNVEFNRSTYTDGGAYLRLSSNGKTIGLHVGTGGTNRGIYDWGLNTWMAYTDGTNIIFNGNANSATRLTVSAGSVNSPVYFSNGQPVVTNNKLGAINANGYWGMRGADNGDSWIRTTSSGIIPVQSGGAGSGHCGLGTSSWYFSYLYVDNSYAVHQRSSGRAYMGEWIEFSDAAGLYWPNANSAYLYANNVSSYGGLVTQGARGGYCGIHLGPNASYMTIMSTDVHQGLFAQNKRWLFYYNRSNDRVALMSSDVSAGYSVQVNGSMYISSVLCVATDSDVTTAGGTGSIRIGSASGTNLGIDGNEIMARSGSTASTLYLNSEGGQVVGYQLWASSGPNGERQVGVSSGTSGNLYLYANTTRKGLYSGSGYYTGYIIRVESGNLYFGNASYFARLDGNIWKITSSEAVGFFKADYNAQAIKTGGLVSSYTYNDNAGPGVLVLDRNTTNTGETSIYFCTQGSARAGFTFLANKVTYSSRERKKNIFPLPSFGDAIDKLQPVSFCYKQDKDTDIIYGLIYEDTINILPYICFTNPGDKIDKGICYEKLIPIFLKEIQDLRKRVKTLESQVKHLTDLKY